MKILKFLTAVVAVLSITFGVPAAVLAAPAAVYPTNGQLIYTYSSGFEFQWGSAGSMLTTSYDIEISTDPTFTNTAPGVMVDSNDGRHTTSNCGSTVQPNNFPSSYAYLPATTYYWRIQAYNNTLCTALGATPFVTGGTGWAVYYFRTAILAPTLTSPTPGSVLSDNMNNDPSVTPPHPLPMFQWTAVSGASGYVLQVSGFANFGSLYINTSVPYSNTWDGGAHIGFSLSSDLVPNTLLYWRVETLSSLYGPSAWSSTPAPACLSGYCSFTTANVSAAPVPIQSGPGRSGNGKVTTDFTPGLRWNEIALPSGSTFSTYEVAASMDSSFKDSTQGCFDVTSASAGLSLLANQVLNNDFANYNYAQLDTATALAAGPVGVNCQTSGGKFNPVNQFFWRVRAVFSGPTYSDWSKVFSFKTSYPKVSTLNAAVTDPVHRTIKFSWVDISPGPGYYWVQACFAADFHEGSCVMSQKPVSNPYLWMIPKTNARIVPGGTLYWRVASGGLWGPSLWTDSGYANSSVTIP